jgi:uncharacterized membrane protein YphA (DoxX/SURF4 family)
MIKDLLSRKYLILFSRILLGAIFVYASIDKIIHPLAFAQVLHHYRLAPPGWINYISVVMPWLEFICGVMLITGCRVKGANLIIALMLLFFIVILSITAARGINVACGCFSTSSTVKSNLILRVIEDIGMLLLSLHVFFFYREKRRVA